MRRIVPILGVAVLIVLLVLVNRGINKTAHPDTDEDAPAASPQASQTKSASSPQTSAGPGNDLPAEMTIGDAATAKYKVTVGWMYDEVNQANPQALAEALQAVQKAAQSSGGTASTEIVDLDVPQSELSPLARTVSHLGVSVNGKLVSSANLGEPGSTGSILTRELQQSFAGK